jgi:hypothetical protein
VRELPGHDLRWLGFQVPGNPWNSPPLVFGHRLIYRTRVQIPEEAAGRGFRLHFSGTNWIVSVFVNGRLAGTHKGVWVPWDLDITPHIRPGEVNELAVAVKGTYYALDAAGMGGGTLHSHSNRPLDRKQWTRWMAPMYPSAKGDGDGYQYGIVNPVTLICTGPAYTEDVFVKPSVRDRSLGLEYTVRNAASRPLQTAAIGDRSGPRRDGPGRSDVDDDARAARTGQDGYVPDGCFGVGKPEALVAAAESRSVPVADHAARRRPGVGRPRAVVRVPRSDARRHRAVPERRPPQPLELGRRIGRHDIEPRGLGRVVAGRRQPLHPLRQRPADRAGAAVARETVWNSSTARASPAACVR